MNFGKKIVLTYCPSQFERNRICGHTFEVMDYYLLFHELGYSVNILIQENSPKNIFYKAWEDKYILPNDYKKDIIFNFKRKIIKGDILIFTDGLYDYYWDKYVLLFEKLILLRCNKITDYSKILKNDKVYLLQDKRIYKDYDNFNNCINYVKKINFKYFKTIRNSVQNKTLIYINTNLRKLDNITDNENILYVSGTKHNFGDFVLTAPVENIFEKFNSFLYTKTKFQFDCSPRFIAECKFYNKKILFDFNFEEYCGPDYGDTGLYWRWWDINNNFENIELKENDELLEYTK